MSQAVPFPVTHSVLSPTALLSEVLSNYDIGNQVSCLFLAPGVNDTYLVRTSTGRYILRVYRAYWRELSDILYEIDVLMHLDRKGVSVSMPIARTDGSFVCTLQAPEGPRQVVLFTYAPGEPLNRHDVAHNYYHGGALAAIHNATDDFASQHVRNPFDLDYLINQSLQMIQPLYAHRSEDWAYLQGLAERLRTRVLHLSLQHLDWGVCHGDCHTSNDHIVDDHTITFFDFDCCAPGWRAYDLAIVRWSEGFYKMDPDDTLWRSFLKGYTEQRHVTDADFAAIPVFVPLREIWHVALGALTPNLGFKSFDKNFDRTFRLLREWEATHLNS